MDEVYLDAATDPYQLLQPAAGKFVRRPESPTD
jgi:hypothetical protein